MITKQSQADSIPAADVRADAGQQKSITPPFRALGIPALAAATRSVPKRPAEVRRELPPFLRHPHGS